MSDINITVTDRDKNIHKIIAPTDMAMNLMELIKAYELAPEGTIGVWRRNENVKSCQCYITSNHQLPEMESEEEAMLSEAFNVKDNSRLGCQIFINENLDGFAFEIAPE